MHDPVNCLIELIRIVNSHFSNEKIVIISTYKLTNICNNYMYYYANKNTYNQICCETKNYTLKINDKNVDYIYLMKESGKNICAGVEKVKLYSIKVGTKYKSMIST